MYTVRILRRLRFNNRQRSDISSMPSREKRQTIVMASDSRYIVAFMSTTSTNDIKMGKPNGQSYMS